MLQPSIGFCRISEASNVSKKIAKIRQKHKKNILLTTSRFYTLPLLLLLTGLSVLSPDHQHHHWQPLNKHKHTGHNQTNFDNTFNLPGVSGLLGTFGRWTWRLHLSLSVQAIPRLSLASGKNGCWSCRALAWREVTVGVVEVPNPYIPQPNLSKGRLANKWYFPWAKTWDTRNLCQTFFLNISRLRARRMSERWRVL